MDRSENWSRHVALWHPWRAAALVGALGAAALPRPAAATVAPSAAAPPAQIERVRYEADSGSMRVVVLMSRRVPYEVSVLAGDPTRGSERRIVLDFSNARLGTGAVVPIGVEDGILQRIRTGQFTARTARVVLDLASVTGHTVTELDDPPRVVIDIVGKASAAAPSAAARASDIEPAAAAPAAASAVTAPPAAAPAAAVREAAPTREPTAPPTRGASGDSATASASLPARTETKAPAQAPSARRSGAGARGGSREGAQWLIVLDPGHGGHDPGAQGIDGVFEKDVTLAIARELKRRLEKEENITVLLTRNGDETRTLADRTAFANAHGADLFVSIHTNADRAGELHGIETYTLNNTDDRATIRLAKMENGPGVRVGRGDLSFILSDMVQSGKEEESNALAERLHSRVLARLRSRYPDVRNLGVKKGPFYVLVGAYMPCVLVETSFLSHPVEGKRLGSPEYQADVAEGLYAGVMDYLGAAQLAKTL